MLQLLILLDLQFYSVKPKSPQFAFVEFEILERQPVAPARLSESKEMKGQRSRDFSKPKCPSFSGIKQNTISRNWLPASQADRTRATEEPPLVASPGSFRDPRADRGDSGFGIRSNLKSSFLARNSKGIAETFSRKQVGG